jgi:hypothetical protein
MGMRTASGILVIATMLEFSGILGRVKGNLGFGPKECTGEKITLIKGEGPRENACVRCGTPVKKNKSFCPCCGKKYSGHDDILVEWD